MAKNPFDDDEDPRASEFNATDEEELIDEQEATDEEVTASLTPETSVDTYDALDLECEKRFEVAMYYRTLLKGRLFNESTDASKVVEGEARAFFKERLETLLGIRTPKPAQEQTSLPFNEEEVAALKAVAKRLVAKPELIEARSVQPKLRQASVPSAPSRSVPVAAKTNVQPKPVSATKKVRVKAPPRPVNPDREVVVEDTGRVIKEGHKTFRIVKNDLGTEFKQDLTTQGNPPGRVAMPVGSMLGQVTETQSAHQISKLDIQVEGHRVGVQQLAAKVSE